MNTRTSAALAVGIVVLVAIGIYAGTTFGPGRVSTVTNTLTNTLTKTSTATSVSTATATSTVSATTTSANNSINVVNIGYFANVNHAQAIVGIASGEFQSYLGPSTKVSTQIFTAGGTEMTALLAGKLDMAFVGPDPAVNAYLASNGTGLQILSGVASGGALFVVTNTSGITPGDVKDLGGKTFAAPQLGNTQDIALRHYLLENGLKATTAGGNVTIEDTPNSDIVSLFATGKIDGAWVPQPWGEILLSMGGELFLNEQSLWPSGQFSTAVLVVRTAFLNQHPDVVKEVVEAEVAETLQLNSNLTQTANVLNTDYGTLTGAPIPLSEMTASLNTLQLTYDPLESTVITQGQYEYQLGFITTDPNASNLANLFNLSILNQVLLADGLPVVSS